MFESLRNILHIKELRNKILVTLGLVAVYRLGCFLPTPGVDGTALSQFFNEMSSRQAGGSSMFGFANLFTGGALGRMSVFALGTMPYISASIIMQLLTVVIPSLEKLSKEGKTGHEKITQYSRFLTLALASLQGFFLALWLQSKDAFMGYTIVPYPGLVFQLSTVATLCCGTLLVMWLGEQIQERGIGNGISILICAGILDRVPSAVYQIGNLYSQHLMSTFTLVALLSLWAAVMVAVVMFSQAQRRITINYARRMVGKKVYGGQTTYLPIKVDMSGIIAIIFAGSVLSFPSTLAMFMKQSDQVTGFISFFQNQGVVYNLVYVALIVFFMFFYTAIVFNPVEIANNLKKHGGFIPGVRPGDNTAQYLDTVTTRLVFCGALYVCAIAILPTLIMKNFGIKSYDVASFFGGTSVLIYVGVMLDTLRQIEGQLILHNYDGFLKMGRLQGRR